MGTLFSNLDIFIKNESFPHNRASLGKCTQPPRAAPDKPDLVAVVWFCLSPEETALVSQAAGLRDGGINSRLVKPAAGSISWARHRPRGPVRKNKEAQPTPASRLST